VTDDIDLGQLRADVQAEIDSVLARQRQVLGELGVDTAPLLACVVSLLHGGKRLRAAFCFTAYLAAGGRNRPGALRAAAAMELFQAAALLHDDVMDDSDTRRGRPAAHRALAEHHRSHGWSGDSARFGAAAAILAGDLCLVWSDELLTASGWAEPELARARPVFDAMRTQLMGGQFLDVLVSARGWAELSTEQRVAQARHVIRFKSAKYTVEQPLLIGAHAGGAGARDLALLSRFGLDLGEAFQLRDDVLGVYGDPRETGKPAGDDLREGKLTMLIAWAADQAGPQQLARLRAGLGQADLTADQVDELREVIVDTGALDRAEDRITELTASARAALDASTGLGEPGVALLRHLADVATARVS
jgi:geranylgeranyl diphosphate synthase type I